MIWYLMVAFAVKHFLCDFVLQTQSMVMGKGRDTDWFKPLLAHSTVQAVGTYFVLFPFAWYAAPSLAQRLWVWFAMVTFDLVAHFIIDRIKAVASRNLLPSCPAFWWALGADQLAHGLTYITIIYVVMWFS